MAATAVTVRAALPLCVQCRDTRVESRTDLALLRQRVAAGEASEARAFDERHLAGYSIVYNSLSVDLGGFREMIRPEATVRTLRQRTDLLALWNHNSDIPLGRITAGTLRVSSDDRGFWSAVLPPTEAKAQVEAVALENVQGQSFAFRALEDDWYMKDDTVIREVLDMFMSEISFVTFPAYPETTARLERAGANGRSVDWMRRVHRTKLAGGV